MRSFGLGLVSVCQAELESEGGVSKPFFFSQTDDRFIILKTKTKFVINFHKVKTKFLHICKQKTEGKERKKV